jgi:hypothetical protein
MPRKSKEERIELTIKEALRLGIPERHAKVLAKVSQRRNLDGRVRVLIGRSLCNKPRDYALMTQAYQQMMEDPTSFYENHKKQRLLGHNKFHKYGSLSRMYSFASPIRLIHTLLEDAQAIREMAKIIKEREGVLDPREEYYDLPFEKMRFARLEEAFRQDLRGNGIDSEMTETLLNSIGWKKAAIIDLYGGVFLPSKQLMMDGFYVFFSSERGSKFIEEWKNLENRDDLMEEFSHGFYNNPRINPSLVELGPENIGSPAFEKKYRDYGDEGYHTLDGTFHRNAGRDARDNPNIAKLLEVIK